MARPLDPYRTLELPRDATLDDVKAAYRRLAKLYHPDSGGERALARFLAVQAAYEALTEGPGRLRAVLGGRSRSATPASGRPSAARPGRPAADPWAGRSTGFGPRAARGTTGTPGASATGRAAPGASGARPGARPGSAAGSSSGGSSTASGPASADGAAGGRTGSSRTRGPAGPRPRRTRRSPGSTSYDGAESEPFEPEWQGASWYGGSSGTYWTLNPREFADPRKHGPDYLARGTDNGRGASRPGHARPAGARGTGRDAGTGFPAGAFDGADGTGAAADDTRDAFRPADPSFGQAHAEPGRGSGGSHARSIGRTGGPDVSALGLVAAALLAIGMVAVLFAVMAGPAAPGAASLVPIVAFCGIAIVALVRVLRRDGGPRA